MVRSAATPRVSNHEAKGLRGIIMRIVLLPGDGIGPEITAATSDASAAMR